MTTGQTTERKTITSKHLDTISSTHLGKTQILFKIVGLIIISLITSVFGPGPFKNILIGQTFLMIFDGVALCLTFIFLIVYFFNLHITHLHFWPWNVSDLIFSTVAAITFVVLGLLEAYYATGAWSNNCNDIGGDAYL
uniref:MARVEL domain-containing protein n=1 Tax=Ditylenchus dipsaci TaxID=166011 RepID=A0A915DDM3_9BILA